MCLIREFAKFVVLAFNLIFLLVGGALITVGAFYLAQFNDVTDAIPKDYAVIHLVPILTIVVGSIIFVISFFGFCGACKDSSCLLTTYAVILLVIFILQIALGVYTFLTVKNEDDFRDKIKNSIDTTFGKTDNATKEVINFIQSELKCCGTFGPGYWTDQKEPIPKSCYKDEDTKKEPYSDGCEGEFFDFLKDASRIIGIVVLALAATEVLGAIFSLCLSNSIRNDARRGGYY